ncbi:MAG: hypothetical protein AB7O43_04365 [Hyphomicrobiaceae bacterium]
MSLSSQSRPAQQGDTALVLRVGQATHETLLQLITRIEGVLDEERNLLAGCSREEFDRVVARKDYLALELMRLLQGAGKVPADDALRARLSQTVDKLSENARILRRHIDAVSAISMLIADVLNSEASDGTYSIDVARQGRHS